MSLPLDIISEIGKLSTWKTRLSLSSTCTSVYKKLSWHKFTYCSIPKYIFAVFSVSYVLRCPSPNFYIGCQVGDVNYLDHVNIVCLTYDVDRALSVMDEDKVLYMMKYDFHTNTYQEVEILEGINVRQEYYIQHYARNHQEQVKSFNQHSIIRIVRIDRYEYLDVEAVEKIIVECDTPNDSYTLYDDKLSNDFGDPETTRWECCPLIV